MNRAYSLLEIKAVEDEQRIIRGIATSPSPDRVGDIVEPLGVKFKNPMPLLHQHDSSRPVGTVRFDKPTKAGITFEAKLPTIDEPGPLKDRVDTAWGEVKSGLVRAVSIGFRALEYSVMDDGGYRFMESEVLELSLVTIPANADATILSIKSIDTQLRAASGTKQRAVVSLRPAGASASTQRPKEAKSMNVSDQIKSLEATRAAKAARMEEVMKASVDAGRTTDASEAEEFDTIEQEVAQIDKDLERLRKLEKAQAAAAKPVIATDVTTTQRGSEVRGGGVIAVQRKLEKGIQFARFVGCMAMAKGSASEALNLAKQIFPNEKPLHDTLSVHTRMNGEMVLRAAVAAGTTTDSSWAGPLVQYTDMVEEFIEFLRPQTIIGKFGTNGVPSLRRVPFNIRVPRQTSGGSASWVGEKAPKPVTSFAFDNVTLQWAKLAAISVITDELARFSSPSAETIIRDQLAAAIVQQSDSDFVNPANAGTANVKPASITNGVTAISTTGTNADAVRTDVANIFQPWINANMTPSSAVWIMSATTALKLSLMRNSLGQREFPDVTMMGGRFEGLPVIVSETLGLLSTGSPSSPIVILANANDIMLADDGQVTIDVSREASLQMDSAPDNPPTASTVFQSLWQTNSIGIKAERYINWVKARPQAVQYLDSVNWA